MRAIKVLSGFYLMLLMLLSIQQLSCQSENNKNNKNLLKLALFDSVGQERWAYRPFIKLAQSAGFSVKYVPIDQIMDSTISQLNLSSYDAAFFITGGEFFGGIQKSAVCQKFLQLMRSYAVLKNRLIGLALPGASVPPNTSVIGAYAPVLGALGIPVALASGQQFAAQHATQHKLHAFLNTCNLFLTTPLERRSCAYHTTLNAPHHGFVWDCDAVQNRLLAQKSGVYLLPMRRTCSKEVERSLPYGVYWNDAKTQNHVALISPAMLSFGGISESFHITPISPTLKKEMLSMVQRMLCELKTLMTSSDKNIEQTIYLLKNGTASAPFPEKLQLVGNAVQTPRNHMRKTAWMEIPAFYDDDFPKNFTREQKQAAQADRAARQDALINYTLTSGLDALWISITPNIYYSPIAKMVKPDAAQTKILQKKFVDSLSLFTKKLKQGAERLKCSIPKIIVGFEVANNLYPPNMPKNFALDLYGNEYRDIPAPLEQSFWEQEVKIPLDVFLKTWNNPNVGRGIPISGVMLDLEMYCRKTTGTFLTTMGFDAQTFSQFRSDKNGSALGKPIHDRVQYLMQHQLTEKYFQFLEQKAGSLGDSLKQFFLKKIPGCQIMCYTPNILSNWFYKGLCKGLSKGRSDPLYLLTFNSEFSLHKRWFEKNNIPVSHACVLLLSKLQKPDDSTLVEEILRTHHGVWYNRFSRLAEKHEPGSWINVEQSPMSDEQKAQFFARARALK
jgi:hypothetical protein